AVWTSITEDHDLVKHLLALYFCWEYPTFASLSKEHFLQDFQNGHPRYCSPILTNALLALGCRFSTQPMTRANPRDPYSSGDHFFKESQRLLSQETDHHSLTTIQALGIMSIREASCARNPESLYYAGQSTRLAIEMGLHHINNEGDEDEVAVRSATFWGAFSLDHAWSLATGSLPQFSQRPHLHPKPAIIDDIETSPWVPYTDDGARLQHSWEQPANVRSVYKCFCELSELVYQAIYVLHMPTKPLTARDLLSLYTQYLTWYDQTPEALRLGHNFTPAVLFAHMYYHFAILLLFKPLIKLRIIGSELSPREICVQAAVAIQTLLRSYSQLYTLRRTPSFVPYFVLTSTIAYVTISANSTQPDLSDSTQKPVEKVTKLDPQVSKVISQSIADLTEMASSHHSAKKALNVLQYLAKQWSTDVDVASGRPPPEDLERIVQSHTGGMNFFAPSVQAADPLSGLESARGASLGHRNVQTGLNAEVDMVNRPFGPFFMQGQPMMPSGESLEQAGFTAL
ncbi:fungal-specific transcription factor domain-containing protein, partial [Dactylonectria estremocensis]